MVGYERELELTLLSYMGFNINKTLQVAERILKLVYPSA